MNKHSVLVTGGAGYIGSHTVLSLLAAGYKPIVIDNLSTGFAENLPSDVPLVTADIRRIDQVKAVIARYECQSVMHFAGSTIVPESVADPLKYYDNNTRGSMQLLSACKSAGIRHFIFSSTAAVYGNPQSLPVSESALPAPITPYGSSKLMTEMMLRDLGASSPLHWAALRYFNVAGADPAGRTGQSTQGATHLIKVACEAMLGKRRALTIYGDDYDTPDGTCIRDFIHVSDLADAHVATLRWLEGGGKGLVANCGYGHGFSIRQIITALEAVAGKKLPVKTGPRRDGDIVDICADSRLLRTTVGWNPRFDDIKTILSTALKWEAGLGARHFQSA